jgi:dTDP-4-amino-4,6-dideoxygalactose transaminase
VALIDFEAAGTDRGTVMRELLARGIGTQVHYLPVHLQPYYRERYGRQHLPGAERYYARCLSLPLFPAMEDADVDRVVTALEQIVGRP